MISRFPDLYKPDLVKTEQIHWEDLFCEFSVKQPFRGNHHPGWSPAVFDPPHRALQNVQSISALTLDYDNKTKTDDCVENPVTIDQIAEQLGDYYGFIHTTRHHTPTWPRFRVIIPLTRPINKIEYTALWNRAAQKWPGLDPNPKDPSRFWYTPGVADHEGADFECRVLTGAYLNPDEFLDKPPTEIVKKTKPGSLLETRARAYLEKMPPSISGAGGHNALFAAARKLVCDFGLDEQAAFRILVSEFNPRCQPPWTEKDIRHKIESAANQARVRVPIEDRQLPGVVNLPPPEAKAIVTQDWKKSLRYGVGGNHDKLTKDVGNVTLLLANSSGFAGCLAYNTMTQRCFWLMAPKYEAGMTAPRAGEPLDDHHAVYIQHVMAFHYHMSIGKDIAWQAMEAAAHENTIHPVQDYFSQLPAWDGKQRLRQWLATYVGCDDTDYNAAIGRWWMISAVARAMRPGCQADHVLILEGTQGAGKSQAIRALGEPWVLGNLPDIRDANRAADTIAGYWIVEIAELDAFKGASMTKIKEFVSQQFDVYRKAYGRATISRPRNCVFVGTTNESTYLNDPTGARRFWPATVKREIDIEGLRADRDQLWAEAKAAFDAGEQWHPYREYAALMEEEQSARYIEDDWTGIVSDWVQARESDEGFTIDEILRGPLMIEPRFWDKPSQIRVGSILTKLGCTRKRVMINGRRAYRYFR